jgi:serine/threonine protein kinase
MHEVVKQMTTALAYLHGKKILHLDIKLDNILFDHPSGEPEAHFYLGDLGLAIAEAELLGVSRLGTPFYMAPEVMLGFSQTATLTTSGRLP